MNAEPVSRALLLLLLLIGALGGGAMGLCGGYHLIRTTLKAPGSLPMVAIVAVPSLMFGVALAWMCVGSMRPTDSSNQVAPTESPREPTP